jgi:ribulose-bisphosphate carboxylase large chain
MGPAAGVIALQQAWQAAVDGLSVEQAAAAYPEFNESVKKFGAKNK